MMPKDRRSFSHLVNSTYSRLYDDQPLNQRSGTLTILSERLAFLRQAIQKIQQQIEARQKLSEGFKQQLGEEMAGFEQLLSEVKHSWRMGYNPSLDARRNHLEKKLTDLRHELRMNHLNSWRDIVWLERELREILEEYLSLVRILNSSSP